VNVAVIGAGSWGTTLADLLARNGHRVALWAREPEVVASINARRVNELFLPDAPIHSAVTACEEIADAAAGAEMIVSATPSHAVRSTAQVVARAIAGQRPVVVSVSKGLEPETHHLLSQALGAALPDCPVAVLSGPSFAREVYDQLPTAVVTAAGTPDVAQRVQAAFATRYFRVYWSQDMIGVQLGGALKNVIALASGILVGAGLGFNTQAALITRGLAEIARLGAALGADPLTFAGLAGMGDLLLTTTGTLSRNRSLGIELGKGRALAELLAERRTVAEGVNTARAALALADQAGVELPIAYEVERVLFENKSPHQAIADLMERTLKAEQWR
jgi:glycerol-3-phosphate dehydrogenase (NAD(P)+)